MSKSKEPIIWQCEHCGAFNNINNSSYFVDKNNQVNRKLLGLWVSHLEGDKVIQNNNQFSICQLIEEAKILS